MSIKNMLALIDQLIQNGVNVLLTPEGKGLLAKARQNKEHTKTDFI